MCGDLDETTGLDDELSARFIRAAKLLLAPHQDSQAASDQAQPYAYAETLFHDALARSLRDIEAAHHAAPGSAPAPHGQDAYGRLALQPLVFARLAGLIAGHLALGEDPLRKTIEALMHGYQEAEALASAQAHGHHDHGHGHGHQHDPGHDHHH